jgi:hypothetical protein
LAALPDRHLAIGLTRAEWEGIYAPALRRTVDNDTYAVGARAVEVWYWPWKSQVVPDAAAVVRRIQWMYPVPVSIDVARVDVEALLPADARPASPPGYGIRSIDQHYHSDTLAATLSDLPVNYSQGYWQSKARDLRVGYTSDNARFGIDRATTSQVMLMAW